MNTQNFFAGSGPAGQNNGSNGGYYNNQNGGGNSGAGVTDPRYAAGSGTDQQQKQSLMMSAQQQACDLSNTQIGGGVPTGAGGPTAATPGGQQDFAGLMSALSKLQQIAVQQQPSTAASTTPPPPNGDRVQNIGQDVTAASGANGIYQQQPQENGSSNNASDQTSNNGSINFGMLGQHAAQNLSLQSMLAGGPGANPMAAGAFMGMPGAAGGFPAPGAPGFMGFDMNAAQMGGFNPYLMGFPQAVAPIMNPAMFAGTSWPGSSSFHTPGQKNEIKLFVGGLQFQTQEPDLYNYFQQFGTVLDQIVMRDKNTNRGRGFGFVKMSFKDEEEAQRAKEQIINQNQYPGHIILDKKVDVKSADDFHDKKQGGMGASGLSSPTSNLDFQFGGQIGLPPGMMPGFGVPGMGPAGAFPPGLPGVAPVSKPNPYAIAETKIKGENNFEVSFKYPRSKIFVGGLDFKLTQDELKYHFQQYGEVVDACILKDIYTGQSRGFGFVTFKDEDTAQHLINNIQVTTINGRKADIKKAEVKAGGQPGFGGPGGPSGGGAPGGGFKGGFREQQGPATIPPYGSGGKDDSSGSRGYEQNSNNDSSFYFSDDSFKYNYERDMGGHHGQRGDHNRDRHHGGGGRDFGGDRGRSGGFGRDRSRSRDRKRSHSRDRNKRPGGGFDNRGQQDYGRRGHQGGGGAMHHNNGGDRGPRRREDSPRDKRRHSRS